MFGSRGCGRTNSRICKPGGLVITIGPVSWPYHEAPIDCWRAYPEGMRALHEDAGLVVELAIVESLEPKPTRHTYFGTGQSSIGKRSIRFARTCRLIGWPTPVALDAVCIASKLAPPPDEERG